MPAPPDDHFRRALAGLPGGEQLLADARLGAAIHDALQCAGLLILAVDAEDGASATVPGGPAGRRCAARSTLLAALESLLGQEPRRRCARCGWSRLLCEFSRAASYCKGCERQRVAQARKAVKSTS